MDLQVRLKAGGGQLVGQDDVLCGGGREGAGAGGQWVNSRGEVVAWYRSGERCVLSQEMEQAAESVRESHTDIGMVTETVLAFLEKPITDDWYTRSLFSRQQLLGKVAISGTAVECTVRRDFISTREIWKEALDGDTETPNADMRREINAAMAYLRTHGWTRASHRIGTDYSKNPVSGLKRQ